MYCECNSNKCRTLLVLQEKAPKASPKKAAKGEKKEKKVRPQRPIDWQPDCGRFAAVHDLASFQMI